MSLVIQIPPGSDFRQPVIQFTAVFNAVTPGFYDWNSAGNTDVLFNPEFELKKNHLYLIDRYNFSADIAELDFTTALNGGVMPTLQLRIPSQTNRQIYPNAIPQINFVDGLETLIAVFADQLDSLRGTFRGRLTQPFALIGTNSITVFFQANVYEIKNKAWIDNFLGKTRDGQAPALLMPSRRGR